MAIILLKHFCHCGLVQTEEKIKMKGMFWPCCEDESKMMKVWMWHFTGATTTASTCHREVDDSAKRWQEVVVSRLSRNLRLTCWGRENPDIVPIVHTLHYVLCPHTCQVPLYMLFVTGLSRNTQTVQLASASSLFSFLFFC